MTRVLIADDHAVVRTGLRQFLASTRDLEVVAEAGTGAEALDYLSHGQCDLLLLDIGLPDLDGMEVLRRVKIAHPELPVLMFSMHSEDEFAVAALNAGASGYLSKSSHPQEILAALRTIAAGERFVSHELAQHLLAGTLCPGKKLPHETLSPREMQAMLDISKGLTLVKIGEHLHLSAKTVSTYRSRILEKMGMESNAELTRYVLEHKLG